jgi:hypothetical protein
VDLPSTQLPGAPIFAVIAEDCFLIDNNMVARADHGMIRPEGRSR